MDNLTIFLWQLVEALTACMAIYFIVMLTVIGTMQLIELVKKKRVNKEKIKKLIKENK
jgi:hypothetical protein